MLLLRRDHLDLDVLSESLAQSAGSLQTILTGDPPSAAELPDTDESQEVGILPDPSESDLNPWVLRRLTLATEIAERLRNEADDALRASAA
jgi:hypothetical protein